MKSPGRTRKNNMTEKENIPMVPKYQAEEMAMHMGRANRNMMIVVIAVCAAMVAMVVIFVNGYTSRTKDWLNTLAQIQSKTAITEVTDGHEADP